MGRVGETQPGRQSQFPGARVSGPDGKDVCELPVRQEILPNGKTYVTIDMGPSALDWYGPVRVPAFAAHDSAVARSE